MKYAYERINDIIKKYVIKLKCWYSFYNSIFLSTHCEYLTILENISIFLILFEPIHQ